VEIVWDAVRIFIEQNKAIPGGMAFFSAGWQFEMLIAMA
jgi:hypothetical protein